MVDNPPSIGCIYCDEVVPRYKYNNHMAINHSPPTAQDRANYERKFYPGRATAPADSSARNPPTPRNGPSNSASLSADSPFAAWKARFGGSNATAPRVTPDHITAFRVDRSDRPQIAAQESLKSTKWDVDEIVRDFRTLPRGSRAECCDIVRQMHVFPALTAFVFTHIKMCGPEKRSMTDELLQKVRHWGSQGEEWCLMNYNTIKEDLLRVLKDIRVDHHVCNDKLVAGNRLHPLDIRNLGALLVMYAIDQDRAGMFYEMKDGQAQTILDLLQALLDLKSDQLDAWYKRRFLDAVIRLAKKSRLYPQSLLISGVKDRIPTDKKGGFGVIYKGNLSGRVVAVKELQNVEHSTDKVMKSICSEAVVWRNVHHPNCLPFYGVVRINDGASTSCLVAPWMEKGNLLDYLLDKPEAPRLPFALDVARGLEYLHGMQPTIVHGDLKCLNIFVTVSDRACLADFGLASVHDSLVNVATTAQSIHGTRGFVAPELINSGVSELPGIDQRRCDMFAFGCVIYEMYTGEAPLAGRLANVQIGSGARPSRPTGRSFEKLGLDEEVWSFIQDLWHQVPEVRPVARVAREFLSYKLGWTEQQDDEAWDMGFLSELAIASDPFAFAL